jgi:hypothetical protein
MGLGGSQIGARCGVRRPISGIEPRLLSHLLIYHTVAKREDAMTDYGRYINFY